MKVKNLIMVIAVAAIMFASCEKVKMTEQAVSDNTTKDMVIIDPQWELVPVTKNGGDMRAMNNEYELVGDLYRNLNDLTQAKFEFNAADNLSNPIIERDPNSLVFACPNAKGTKTTKKKDTFVDGVWTEGVEITSCDGEATNCWWGTTEINGKTVKCLYVCNSATR